MHPNEEIVVIDGQEYTYKQLVAVTNITIHGVRNRVAEYRKGRISGPDVFHNGRKPCGGISDSHATDEWKALGSKPRKTKPVKVGTWEQQNLFPTSLYREGERECRICEPSVARAFNV